MPWCLCHAIVPPSACISIVKPCQAVLPLSRPWPSLSLFPFCLGVSSHTLALQHSCCLMTILLLSSQYQRGRPFIIPPWISRVNISIAKSNRNRLRVDPWYNPTTTRKYFNYPPTILIRVLDPLYMFLIILSMLPVHFWPPNSFIKPHLGLCHMLFLGQ